MELRKKISEDTVVSASYLPTGISLRITKKGDRYNNTIVSVALIGGEPKLTIFKDTIERYGLKTKHDKIQPTEW